MIFQNTQVKTIGSSNTPAIRVFGTTSIKVCPGKFSTPYYSSSFSGNQWKKNGAAISGATNQFYTIQYPVLGNPTLLFTSEINCSSGITTSNPPITVNMDPRCARPRFNGSDTFFDNEIIVYPNPTNSDWTIIFEENTPEKLKLELLDMSGFVIKQLNYNDLKSNSITISSEGLKSGMYQLKVYLNDKVETKKLIKE